MWKIPSPANLWTTWIISHSGEIFSNSLLSNYTMWLAELTRSAESRDVQVRQYANSISLRHSRVLRVGIFLHTGQRTEKEKYSKAKKTDKRWNCLSNDTSLRFQTAIAKSESVNHKRNPRSPTRSRVVITIQSTNKHTIQNRERPRTIGL